jgi:signal transduction histidine kinase
MKLPDFIEQEMPAILAEWEAFAATLLPAAATLNSSELRDHAEQMLQTIAADLRAGQTAEHQAQKSKGRLMAARRRYPSTAAQMHAVLRATEGFSIEQLVSEYRALRASVLRLYGQAHAAGPDTLVDIGRFNESIDQAIAESVAYYCAEVDRWRNVFLGVLAHDLLGPLNAILLTSRLIAQVSSEPQVDAATKRLMRSSERMKDLIDDLVDYSRTALGLELPVRRESADLQAICATEVELRRAAHPEAQIRLTTPGPVPGSWDPSRLRQLLGNLITNAVKYGDPGEPVDVSLTASEPEARLTVRNCGTVASRDELDSLFEPLRRVPGAGGDDERRHLGLGLFVVREVARAHGGRVGVEAKDGTVTFTVKLPRGTVPAAS